MNNGQNQLKSHFFTILTAWNFENSVHPTADRHAFMYS
jgi:hypothetical protein